MITLEGLTRRYGSSMIVDALDLEIARGELLAIVGPSGCGKTTTLKMINRLLEPTSGRVLFEGTDVRAQPAHLLRRRIGYAFQEVGLFPHLTVFENVAVVPRLCGWSAADTATRVAELLTLFQLEPAIASRRPAQLSGGQAQRVGFARALAARPTALLLDEPFGALDPTTRTHLQDALADLHRTLGLTTLLVTHDMAEALALADRIAVMRAGRLVQVASPAEILRAPADEAVAELLAAPQRSAALVARLTGGSS